MCEITMEGVVLQTINSSMVSTFPFIAAYILGSTHKIQRIELKDRDLINFSLFLKLAL